MIVFMWLEINYILRICEEVCVIVFIFSKGGVGFSFIVSNVGYMLVVYEYKCVLLIDLNM